MHPERMCRVQPAPLLPPAHSHTAHPPAPHPATCSFPRAKWGNNRDKYAYNRVKGALAAYKLELLKHAREYASCKQHTALHAYLLYAAGEVSDMPVFDSGGIRLGAELEEPVAVAWLVC